MFFQFVVGIAIWQYGIVINWVRGFPKFHAGPLLGGFFWATSNLLTVPTIRCVGIGVSNLFWCVVALLVGWSYPRFGWFGLDAQIPTNIMLNYIGLGLAFMSCFILLFVKIEENLSVKMRQSNDNIQERISKNKTILLSNEGDFFDRMSKRNQWLLGVVGSIFAGAINALTYLPAGIIIDNVKGASQNQNDYTFSLTSGIFLSSTLFFLMYCISTKNKPKVSSELFFPSLMSGWIWGIANSAYFIATDTLMMSVTYPLANSGPAVVCFILALFYREIKGRSNILVLALGLFVATSGIIFTGLSY